jgi:Mor family transcriptional regulator
MTEPVINVSDLPLLLQEWVELIGLDNTMQLVERFGGVHIYIPAPQNLACDHWLPQLIGMENALALARRYGRDNPLVPMASRALNKLKEALIRIDIGNGLSVRDIALKHRVHERRVWRIKASADRQNDEPDPQPWLF